MKTLEKPKFWLKAQAMMKHKAGLHKEVSSIFDGVPIPQKGNAQSTPSGPHTPTPGKRTSNTPTPPRPPVPDFQRPAKESSLAATLQSQQQQPAQPPKATPAKPAKSAKSAKPAKPPKDNKANAAITTARQIRWQQALEQIKNKLFASQPGVNAIKQKAMVLLVPILFIVLIVMFTRVLGVSSPKKSVAASIGSSSTTANSSNKIDWQIPALYPTTLRDPMKIVRVTAAANEAGTLTITGIVYSDTPSAVINNQIVSEGDKVSGATVVKINRDSVEFEMNGKKWKQKVQR